MGANPNDLTWLNQVKNWAGVQSPNDDSEIQDAITGFSTWLIDFTGVKSLNAIASYTETRNGNGNNQMFTRNRPIINVTVVTVNGVAIPAAGAYPAFGYYVADDLRSIMIRPVGNPRGFTYYPTYGFGATTIAGGVFAQGVGNVQLGYSAGYAPQTQTNEIETIANAAIALEFPTWVADRGVVYYPSLVPLVAVPSSPAPGQYAVNNGLYVFNPGDNGKQVAVSYTYNAPPFDLEFATRRAVAINWKRKATLDQASKVINAGQTANTIRYRDWAIPPELCRVFEYYQRRAII